MRAAQTSFARHKLNVSVSCSGNDGSLSSQLRMRIVDNIHKYSSVTNSAFHAIGRLVGARNQCRLSLALSRSNPNNNSFGCYSSHYSLSIFNSNWWFITFSAPSLSLSHSLSLSLRGQIELCTLVRVHFNCFVINHSILKMCQCVPWARLRPLKQQLFILFSCRSWLLFCFCVFRFTMMMMSCASAVY